MKTNASRALAAALTLAVALPAAAIAQSHGDHGAGHGAGHGAMIGAPGKTADRTIEIVMHDNYYEPETIAVKPGETIRFRIRNAGEFVHEFNIGTPEMHEGHAGEMQMMVDHGVLMPDRIDHAAAKAMQASMGHGMHDAPNSALIEPGKTAEITWTFPDHMEGLIEFACNVPGHYGAGMVGEFEAGHH
ncbi:cupredoxin domain-containing protein [Rhodovulum sp. DZ06]|uniref:cupredoxin domain-containing protein n=1 Tax=Rhodovulum sp. DZ06 TaxID=3425126 RepID=UPI003D34C6D1